MAEYCTKVEKNILLLGCLGDHVPIVTRALDLMEQPCSTAEVKRIHKIILHESSKYNSDKVIDLVFRIAQFDNAELLKAITLACEYGSIKTLRCLLSKYPRDSLRGGLCGRRRSSNVSRLLVGRPWGGRSLLETLERGLYIAAFNGHAEVVKTLIQEGAYVFEVTPQDPHEEAPDDMSATENKRDRIYQTALQAALSGFAPQLEYDFRQFSAEKSKVTSQDPDEETPDDMSWTKNKQLAIHEQLNIQLTALPAALRPFRQISAEERAAREAIILLLLEHGANANESNEDSD